MSDIYKSNMIFVNQDKLFAHGFECGRFYEMMGNNFKFERHIFNLENEEQIKMMCKRFHYNCMIEKSDDWYGYLTAEIDLSKAN